MPDRSNPKRPEGGAMAEGTKSTVQSKVDQSGADTRTHDPAGSERRHRDRWEASTRRLAERLADELGGNAAEVRRRLQTEHGVTVPPSTVAGWVSRRPVRSAPTAGSIADRAHRLLSLEMDRLERSSVKLDLDRLQKVATTLKALNGLSRGQAAPKVRTLQDLSRSEPETEGPEGVDAGHRNGTQSHPASLSELVSGSP